MPRTPDRRAGELEEEEIVLDNRPPGEVPVLPGAIRFVDGRLNLRDGVGLIRFRGTVVGDVPVLADVGGGQPGFPPGIDGSNLLNVGGSAADFNKVLATVAAGIVLDNAGNVVTRT